MKKFLIFSCIFFLIISLTAIFVYGNLARQINHSYIEQQLSLASETIQLRLATTVNSELALVLKMADTPVIHRYFLNPYDAELKAMAHIEFDVYLHHFKQKTNFWINDIDKLFYWTDNEPYIVDPDDPENYWYNLTLYETERYNFNINYNPEMQQISLWMNVPLFIDTDDGRRPIGMLGSGIDLTEFSHFIVNAFKEFDENITAYTFNKFNEITTAVDYDLVFNKIRIDDYLGETGSELIKAANTLETAENKYFIYNDKMFLVSSIPSMEWYLAVSYPLPGFLALNQSMNTIFFGMLSLVLFMLIIINIFTARSENAIAMQNIQLIEANKKAEIATRAKSKFLANTSHEIRTPMNAITGMAELLLRGDLSDEARSYVQDIKQAGNNLISIINDVLDMSKIESGKLEIIPAVYEFSSLLNDTLTTISLKLKEKPIQFFHNIDRTIPNELIGDVSRMRQILLNLLSNAVKYTESGHISLMITVDKKDDKQIWLKASVSDTGKGIKPEDQELLFGDFVRVDTDQNIEGTGLGLAITKNLCAAMNGEISFESKYGKGSTFTVIIPQAYESDKPFLLIEEQIKIAEKPFEISFTMPQARLLVVDDIPSNLKVAEGLLLYYKARIDTCTNGAEAIELVKNQKYDAVFMDHMMPVMDGIEATTRIRAMGMQVPIIALTANAVVGMREMFLSKGFSDFLAKPIDVSKLDKILDDWIPKEKKSGTTHFAMKFPAQSGISNNKSNSPVLMPEAETEERRTDKLRHKRFALIFQLKDALRTEKTIEAENFLSELGQISKEQDDLKLYHKLYELMLIGETDKMLELLREEQDD